MSLDVATGSLGAKSPSWGLLVYQDLNNPTPASISDLIQLPWLPLLYSLKTQGHSYPKACCSLSLGISTQMSPPPLGFPRPPSGQEPLPPSLSSTSPCSSWHSPMTISPLLSAGRTSGRRPWEQAMWPQRGGPLHHIPDKRGHRHIVCHRPYPRKSKLRWEKNRWLAPHLASPVSGQRRK